MSDYFQCTVGELLEDAARNNPDHSALIYSDPMTTSGKIQKYRLRQDTAVRLGLKKTDIFNDVAAH